LGEFLTTIRETIGYKIPLDSDNFGQMNVESAIRIGIALHEYTLTRYEDIYTEEGFAPLIKARAISVEHPDPGTSSEILEK
jgi:L-alanine-DL-glutamate epimerase-like enolase superfamily enzyme|tara:strand:- start:12 stop:254 length:243 start_codon:yes stop_codon:yes gene_type:complete